MNRCVSAFTTAGCSTFHKTMRHCYDRPALLVAQRSGAKQLCVHVVRRNSHTFCKDLSQIAVRSTNQAGCFVPKSF